MGHARNVRPACETRYGDSQKEVAGVCPPEAAGTHVSDDRALEPCSLRQGSEGRRIGRLARMAEDELEDVARGRVGEWQRREAVLEADDVAVGWQMVGELRREQPGEQRDGAVRALGKVTGEEVACGSDRLV